MNEMQSLQTFMLLLCITAIVIVAGTVFALVMLYRSERPKRTSRLSRSVHDVGTLLHRH